jgi:glycine/D-amino acid oxidase-like deaminating enzyme
VDVAIVGAGVTGCACALHLAEAGLRVRVHEAREVAGGASGRNGGFALRGAAIAYDAARERLGSEQATALWQLTERAVDHMADLAGDAFRRTGSLRLATSAVEATALAAERAALEQDGFVAELQTDLAPPLAGKFEAALVHPRDGAIQPARWVRRLAALAAEAGAEIRERRAVRSVEELEAEVVVLATDGYTQGLVPELDAAVRPTRGQVIATAPLARILYQRPHSTYDGYRYWHQTDDRRFVIGGFRDIALDEEWTREEATTPTIQAALESFARELLGETPEITHRWSGIFGTTEDLLPLVGRLSDERELWVSSGYSGHGNVMGFACGELVANAILGRSGPELELFDPRRFVARTAFS